MKTLKIRKLSHFEHIMRDEKYKILKLIIQDKIEGKKDMEDRLYHGYTGINWFSSG